MQGLTVFVTFALALSTATERITEMLKLFAGFSPKPDEDPEDPKRKRKVVVTSFIVGTILTALLPAQVVQDALNIKSAVSFPWSLFLWIFCGALASSGSGFWNSLLGIVREVDQQKQKVTEALQDFPLLLRIEGASASPGQDVILKGQALWGDELVLIVNDFPQPVSVAVKPGAAVKFPFPGQNPKGQAPWDKAGENAMVAIRVKRGATVIQTEPILVVVK